MSRKVILSLIILMALVMVSLILVQTNSIRKAMEMKREQFDQAASSAIFRVIENMEREELASIRMSRNPINSSQRNSRLFPRVQDPSGIVPQSYSRAEVSVSFQFSERRISGTSFSEELSVSFVDTVGTRKNERGRPGEFPSAFDKLHENTSYWNQRYQERIDQRIMLMELNQGKIQVDNLPVEKRINPQELDRALRQEFRNSGIDLDFEYAVKSFSGTTEKLVLSTQNYKPDNKYKTFSQLLFPTDLNPKPNWLYVYFPKGQGYLLKETGMLIIPTFVLTAMLIGIFVFTIMIILKQKKLSSIKNDFINNMTHELKTPISTISLASQMLRDNSISNTARTIEHVSNVIYQESKRLSFQVEKVLQMAIFNEGRLKLKFKEIDMNEVIRSVILNFELRVKNKNGILEADLKAAHAEIKGDEVHITNVLFNLLDNAVKYSKEEPRIVVSTENKKDFLAVSVKDNGIGIAKEHVDQIFERFYRVPTGNVHDVKGFGLGLSYVKKIVDSHQGKIKVESALHKGTKFIIYFPQNTR
ncbi:MAG: HAMP domain-containing sensor histidine kinase [Prolixibacteraceae bacterium]|jgi:two-component system phosphate regulon sensor histidine kinase PhoR|nr:HAMP domain-containing sensor histidine kinase [Prolixibacteraceae bacterium]